MMNCEQFEQLLDEYLDGELTGFIKLEFETHLVNCESCSHLYAMSEAIGQIISEPSDDEPILSDDFSERVLQELEHHRRRKILLKKIVGPAVIAVSVATILIGIIIFNAIQFDNYNNFGNYNIYDYTQKSQLSSNVPVKLASKHSKLLPIVNQPTIAYKKADRNYKTNLTFKNKIITGNADSTSKLLETNQLSIIEKTNTISADIENSLNQSLAEKSQEIEKSKLQEELNSWLVQTLERAGMTVWELAELKTLAWDKMRESIINSLKAPSLLPVGTVVPINPVINQNQNFDTAEQNNISVDSVEQGLELI